jgi:hypothetical protein
MTHENAHGCNLRDFCSLGGKNFKGRKYNINFLKFSGICIKYYFENQKNVSK